ncbi:MAG: decarboxylating 6-phosphogluconate dehydrogenase [Anaerolineales bacterium]
MKLAMIGLGKMGGNMSRRLLQGGHEVVGYNRSPEKTENLAQETDLEAAFSLQEVVDTLPERKVIWIMVPAGAPIQSTIEELKPFLKAEDIIIDGGNSNYKDTLKRGDQLAKEGIYHIDVGTSGGVWGLEEGYSMMVGGDEEPVDYITPLLETLAPGADQGWGHVGPRGSGHFVKMIHNGIEYGMMQAYAEGFEILKAKEDFDLDLHQVAEIWRFGSVIRSWLLDLTAQALEDNPTMEGIDDWVDDSGEGRWTVFEAIDLDIPAPVITLALQSRLVSRMEDSFAHKLLAAMRNQFGGHAIKKE